MWILAAMLGFSALGDSDLGKCSHKKMADAQPGDTCQTEHASWRVSNESTNGKRVYEDLTSGLKVASPQDGVGSQPQSNVCIDVVKFCEAGYRIPSGYPQSLNGSPRYGFPRRNSDLVQLEIDGFRQVIPSIGKRWVWSSTGYPTFPTYAYFLDATSGYIYYHNCDDGDDLIVCVTHM